MQNINAIVHIYNIRKEREAVRWKLLRLVQRGKPHHVPKRWRVHARQK